ncbi:GntR family transcriptional regulator [Streptomyces sp. M19]
MEGEPDDHLSLFRRIPAPAPTVEQSVVVDKLPDQIYRVLRHRIVHGTMAAGSRISVGDLTAEFGTSKTPVREALNRLEYDQLIVTRPRSGTFVAQPTTADVVEVCQLRKGIEWVATGLAARTMPVALLRDLREEITEAARSAEQGDFEPFFDSDFKLHSVIVEHAGNKRLVRARSSVEPFVQWLRVLGATGPHRIAGSTRRHLEIVDAMLARDADAAMSAAALHIDEVQRWTVEDPGPARATTNQERDHDP